MLRTADGALIGTVGVGEHPEDLAIAPDGRQLYVVNHLSRDVSVLDVATNTVVATVPLPGTPGSIAAGVCS